MPKSPALTTQPPTNNNKDLGISVPDSQTLSSDTKNSKKFTVYKVLVETPEKRFFIFRRYNEFHQLYDKLKKVYPELHLKLPGKKLFGNNFDPEFIQMRREGLNDFVCKILEIKSVSSNPDVREFLQLDNPRNTSINLDEDDDQGVESVMDDGRPGKKQVSPIQEHHQFH